MTKPNDETTADAPTMRSNVCSLVFLRRGDEILLAMKKRGFGVGRYNGAGGKADEGETVEQTMIRECQEEIGVTPTRFTKVAVQHFRGFAPDGGFLNIGHTYFCDEWDGEPHETEEMAPEWFKTSEIPYEQMWEDDFLWLPLVLKGKLLKTAFTFDADDQMLSAYIRVVETLDDSNDDDAS